MTKEDWEARRFIRRPLLPTSIHANVDLYEVICAHQREKVSPNNVEPVIDWILSNKVRLTVVSLPHVLARTGDWSRLLAEAATGAGSERHRELCGIASIYLTAQGKKPLAGGNSLNSYAGGWADVSAEDGSIFVECGNLRGDKAVRALFCGQTIMVIPYGGGVRFDGEEDHCMFMRPEVESAAPQYVRHMSSTYLGFLFEPLVDLRRPATEINALEMPSDLYENNPQRP
jgi:hypothetical protein